MNVLSLLAHAFPSKPVAFDATAAERRRQCADALEAARRGPHDAPADADAEAFAAQCRRVRESHYVDAPADVFHVC